MNKLVNKINNWAPLKAFVRFTQKIHPPGFEQVSLHDVAKFFFRGLKHGALVTRATSVAYFFFLAIFPSIIFLFTLIPYVPIDNFQIRIFEQLRLVMPKAAFETAESTIVEILTQPHKGLLSIGFLLSLWFSTNGFSALIGSFNITYHSVETRTWIQRKLVALVLVIITTDRKSTRLNSSHIQKSRMPSSA